MEKEKESRERAKEKKTAVNVRRQRQAWTEQPSQSEKEKKEKEEGREVGNHRLNILKIKLIFMNLKIKLVQPFRRSTMMTSPPEGYI